MNKKFSIFCILLSFTNICFSMNRSASCGDLTDINETKKSLSSKAFKLERNINCLKTDVERLKLFAQRNERSIRGLGGFVRDNQLTSKEALVLANMSESAKKRKKQIEAAARIFKKLNQCMKCIDDTLEKVGEQDCCGAKCSTITSLGIFGALSFGSLFLFGEYLDSLCKKPIHERPRFCFY